MEEDGPALGGGPEHGGEEEGEANATNELGGEVEPDAPVGVVKGLEGRVHRVFVGVAVKTHVLIDPK